MTSEQAHFADRVNSTVLILVLLHKLKVKNVWGSAQIQIDYIEYVKRLSK